MRGLSLIELLVALTITFAVSMMMFQLFHQNERVIRDQTLIMEMQQTARIVISQIADEVRMAGQGVPVHASNFDTTPSEAVAIFLPSSTSSRIDFRAGLSNIETPATSPPPLDFTLGVSRALSIQDGTGFVIGKFVFVSDGLTWLRCAVTGIGPTTLTVTPHQTGSTNAGVHFGDFPAASLDEAVSIYLSGGSVRRATANDMTIPDNPTWSAANEIGKNVAALGFTYYDRSGASILPNSLSNRLSISRVDVSVT